MQMKYVVFWCFKESIDHKDFNVYLYIVVDEAKLVEEIALTNKFYGTVTIRCKLY